LYTGSQEEWRPVPWTQVHKGNGGQFLGHRYTRIVEARSLDTGKQGKWRPVPGTQVHKGQWSVIHFLGHRYTRDSGVEASFWDTGTQGTVKVRFWYKGNRGTVEDSSWNTAKQRQWMLVPGTQVHRESGGQLLGVRHVTGNDQDFWGNPQSGCSDI
jgi:hypothetical protein